MRNIKKRKTLWEILAQMCLDARTVEPDLIIIARYISIINEWKDALPKKKEKK